MEVLLIVPVLLVSGLFLVYISVAPGQKSLAVPASWKELATNGDVLPRLTAGRQPTTIDTGASMTQSDALPHVLSELIEIRETTTELSRKVENMGEELQGLAKSVEDMKRSDRRAA